MKGKVTSLILVGGAFLVGILTQDGSGSLKMIAGSHALTALIVITWFGVMGGGLYLWAKYTRQQGSQQEAAPAQADANSSLRQLAQAIGPNRIAPMTENITHAEEASPQEATQKSSR